MRRTILDTVDDLASSFLYYDRKEDDELPTGAIEIALDSGEITIEEIVDRFRKSISN